MSSPTVNFTKRFLSISFTKQFSCLFWTYQAGMGAMSKATIDTLRPSDSRLTHWVVHINPFTCFGLDKFSVDKQLCVGLKAHIQTYRHFDWDHVKHNYKTNETFTWMIYAAFVDQQFDWNGHPTRISNNVYMSNALGGLAYSWTRYA